jgi:hypothetical protein
MTLIISAVTSKKMYQVSDTRLTRNGDLYNDYSIKTTLVACKNAFISISYTGLAYLDNLRTDEWLVKILSDFHAWDKTLIEIAEHIKSAATIEFKKINNQILCHSFVIIGYFVNAKCIASPTIGLITNCEDENFKSLNVPLDHFEIRTLTLKKDAKLNESYALCINGMEPATKEEYFRKQLHEFISNKLNNNTDFNDVIKDLVELVRIAASHEKYGKYLNKYCVSVYFEIGNPVVNASYHNLDNKKISYLPNFITKKGLTFTGIEQFFGE